MVNGPERNDIFKGLTVQRTKAQSGKMRLIRTGKKLIYQFADGADVFQDIATKEFGTADVIAVPSLCPTGWQTNWGVEVRLINLDLRPEQMPNKEAPPLPRPAGDPVGGPAAGPERAKSRTWLIAAVLIL